MCWVIHGFVVWKLNTGLVVVYTILELMLNFELEKNMNKNSLIYLHLNLIIFFILSIIPTISGQTAIREVQFKLSKINYSSYNRLKNHPEFETAFAIPISKKIAFQTEIGFYQYKYRVRFKNGELRIVGDPCARYSGSEYENAGIVVGGSTPQENEVPPLDPRLPIGDLVSLCTSRYLAGSPYQRFF